MLIVDSIKSAEQLAFRHYENEQDRYVKWLDEHTFLCRYNDDPLNSPLEAMRKIGRPMSHTELERRLSKLNPSLVFGWGEFNTHHKVMYRPMTIYDPAPPLNLGFNDPYRHYVKLFVYPTGMLPERSIWRKREEWVADPHYIPKPGDIDRSEWEWVSRPGQEHKHKADGYKDPVARFAGRWQRKSDNAGRAGWKKVTHAWGEEKRGWRTVLVNLVRLKLITVQQAEDEFIADNTPEWARHMGKKNIFRPW